MPRSAYRTEHLKRRQLFRRKVRRIHHGDDLRRHHHDVRDALALDSIYEGSCIEFLMQYVRTAQVPRRHERDECTIEDKGPRMEHNTFGREPKAACEECAVHPADVMRVHYAFRRAGCTARVHDVVDIAVSYRRYDGCPVSRIPHHLSQITV